MDTGSDRRTLLVVKVVHTVVWAFFVLCIAAIPVLTWRGELRGATWFVGIVLVEVLVLLINRWSCPLTPIAARYTEDRRANFDIFLPEWLARTNKEVFGGLYLAGVVYLIVRWWAAR
jgi:hypothetical protein